MNITYTLKMPTPAKAAVQSIVEVEIDNPGARAKIEALQATMDALPQVDIPLQHFFAKGLYARQGIVKRGTVVVGAIKKISHINIISSGDVSIFTEEGERRITGAATMVAAPGTKRVAYAHEDTLWTTIMGTDETDVAVIEETLLAKTYEEYQAYCNQLQIQES